MSDNDFRDKLRKELAEEIRRSRHRDRISKERVHPFQADINRFQTFVLARRKSVPGALESLRATFRRVNTDALRHLVDIVHTGGRCDLATERLCDRIDLYCWALDSAVALVTPTKEQQ